MLHCLRIPFVLPIHAGFPRRCFGRLSCRMAACTSRGRSGATHCRCSRCFTTTTRTWPRLCRCCPSRKKQFVCFPFHCFCNNDCFCCTFVCLFPFASFPPRPAVGLVAFVCFWSISVSLSSPTACSVNARHLWRRLPKETKKQKDLPALWKVNIRHFANRLHTMP